WETEAALETRRTESALEIAVEPAGLGRFRAVTIDLGEQSVGTLSVEVEAAAGGEILDFQYHQNLRNGIPDAPAPGNACMVALASRFRPAAGTSHHEFFHIMGIRHITMVVRDSLQPLKVRLSWRTALYPFTMQGRFHCSDDTLNRIYDSCRVTQQICATDARRVYHVIETYVSDQSSSEGHGAYAVAVFRSDRRGLEVVARSIGGHPGTALSSSANATDAERRLIELRGGIARRGFQPNTDTIRAAFPAPGAVRYPFAVVPDRCYTYAALAEGSLSDVDVSVYDPDGEEIARDVRPERDAFVQICPAAAETLSVEVRARPGSGLVLLQSFSADAAQVGGANTLWLGERVAWRASATALPQSIDATRAALESAGFSHATPPASFPLAPGEARTQRVTVEAGRCTAIAAVIGRGLGRASLDVHAANGDFVARGTFQRAATIAVVCPSAREELQLHLHADVGTGDAAIMTAIDGTIPAWASGADRAAVSETLAVELATAGGEWHAE
ncbi:MAG: hypothetical protein WCJ30_29555, partial [Deltaproteobacteria bacterium]